MAPLNLLISSFLTQWIMLAMALKREKREDMGDRKNRDFCHLVHFRKNIEHYYLKRDMM